MAMETRAAVDAALVELRATHGNKEIFDTNDVAEIVHELTGRPLDEAFVEQVRLVLIDSWGEGVEPAGLGVWRFGPARGGHSSEVTRS